MQQNQDVECDREYCGKCREQRDWEHQHNVEWEDYKEEKWI